MAFEDRMNRQRSAFQPGVPIVFQLAPGLNVLRGTVIVNATVTIADCTEVGVPVGEGGPVNLIRRIRVIANRAAGSRYPDGALVDCSPQSLLRYATTERGGFYMAEQGNSNLGGGANGVYNIYLAIPIFFADSLNKNNVQTALNMNPVDSTGAPIYTGVQVQIETAALITELFSGNNGTMTVAGFIEWWDDRLALSADTTPLIQEDHYAYIQQANEEFVDAAMPNNGAFESWLILAQQGSPGWQLSDAILNRLSIQGGTLNFKEHAQDIRQSMFDDELYVPPSDADAYSALGQYFIDWTHGLLANSNPAAGLSHQMSVNNPSGSGLDRLRVYTRRVFTLAGS